MTPWPAFGVGGARAPLIPRRKVAIAPVPATGRRTPRATRRPSHSYAVPRLEAPIESLAARTEGQPDRSARRSLPLRECPAFALREEGKLHLGSLAPCVRLTSPRSSRTLPFALH